MGRITMSLPKRLVLLVSAIFATLLASFAVAKNPFQTMEAENSFSNVYIDCLGETVSGTSYITIKYREFETPSGNYVYVEHWTWTADYLGDTTGRIWFSNAVSPGTQNAGPAATGMYTSVEVAKPVGFKGPTVITHARWKYTVNANGELKVLFGPQFTGSRCVGPNS
jgi:hypothetical protein